MTAGDFILYTTSLLDTAGRDMVAMNGYSKVPCDGRDHDVIFVIGAVKFTPGMTKCLSVAELLVTKAAFSSFTNNPVLGGLRVYFNKAPYVVQRYYGEDSISTTFVDVTGLYKFFTNPTILQVIEKQIAAGQTDMEKAKALADLLKQFNARVKGLNDLVTSYNYKDLIAMFAESHRMFLGEDDRCVVATDFLMNENTREFDEYNARRRKVKAFDYVSSQEVKQDVEDSRLWFYVPTLAQLKISGGEGFKPSWEFGDHYSSSIFRSDLYMIFTEGHWDKVEFLQYCKRTPASGGRRGTLFSGYDVEDESAFLDHEPMEVLGNPENNTLPLQENEQAIRTALVNMVKSSIVNMLEERGEEVTDARVESLYAMNVIPPYTKQYLDSLLEYFLQVNWMHTGKVPQMFDSMDGVEDPEDGPDSFYGYTMSNVSSLEGFQYENFMQFQEKLEKAGVFIPEKHISNTGIILDSPEMNQDIVRFGTMTYGYYSSPANNTARIQLKKAFSVRAEVSYVKDLEADRGIGYALTYVTKRKSRIATIPIGYADIAIKELSNKGEVLIHGKRAPIIGGVCMDQLMADVTDIGDVKIGDIATLIGADGDAKITVDKIAALQNRNAFEIMLSANHRLPRRYWKDGKILKWVDMNLILADHIHLLQN